jgi:hypothetical protein
MTLWNVNLFGPRSKVVLFRCAEGPCLSGVIRTKIRKFSAGYNVVLLQKIIIFVGTGREVSSSDIGWKIILVDESVFFSARFSVWVNWASRQSDYLRQRVITAVRISQPRRHLQVNLSLCTSWSCVGRVGLWRNLFLTSALD